ncbi:2-C-methyl-D-erythritol 4-phosphate cytidylyltransferase [Thiomonas sp.]|uniref:2-C-methyl-D-erythritol 4-phosphate cytidylyltransferase n=1 Tax=Thiomonas sp. TaxID=2047785 RepID=UPI00344F3B70
MIRPSSVVPPSASDPPVSCHALIPCAGSGSRLPGDVPKQYRRLLGDCVVQHTVRAFLRLPRIATVSVVVQAGDALAASCLQSHPRLRLVPRGGASRAHSVLGGLDALLEAGAQPADWVLVHDAARCCVTPRLIDALIDACSTDASGGLLALPLPDTLKLADAQGRVVRTEPREGRWLAQTPQMFRMAALHAALQSAIAAGVPPTDEAGAMERLGARPRLVPGAAFNVKITYPEDLELAQAVLAQRAGEPA